MQAETLLNIEEFENEGFNNVLVIRYLKLIEWKYIAKKLYVHYLLQEIAL